VARVFGRDFDKVTNYCLGKHLLKKGAGIGRSHDHLEDGRTEKCWFESLAGRMGPFVTQKVRTTEGGGTLRVGTKYIGFCFLWGGLEKMGRGES